MFCHLNAYACYAVDLRCYWMIKMIIWSTRPLSGANLFYLFFFLLRVLNVTFQVEDHVWVNCPCLDKGWLPNKAIMSEQFVWAKNSSCSKMDTHHYQGHCGVLNTLVHLAFPARAGKWMNGYNSCPQFLFLPNDLSTPEDVWKKFYIHTLKHKLR